MEKSASTIVEKKCGLVAYRQCGKKTTEGGTLVFLHGNSLSSQAFTAVMSHPLMQGQHAIAFDLPGHGKSAPMPADVSYSFETMGSRILKAINALDLKNVIVVGWSLGGHIAIDMLDRSDRIRSAVIMGTPPLGGGALSMLWAYHFSLDMLLASKKYFTRTDAARFERLVIGSSANGAFVDTIQETDVVMRPSIARSVLSGANRDQADLLLSANKPVMIMQGENDPLVRTAYLANFTKGRDFQGQYLSVAHAGHAPFMDQPTQFIEALLDFASTAHGKRADVSSRRFAA